MKMPAFRGVKISQVFFASAPVTGRRRRYSPSAFTAALLARVGFRRRPHSVEVQQAFEPAAAQVSHGSAAMCPAHWISRNKLGAINRLAPVDKYGCSFRV